MRVLLDTHVWLWMIAAPERLSKKSRSIVIAAENELVLSAASAWEIAIKFALGTLHLPETPESYIPRLMVRTSVTALPVHARHALHVATLPTHHRDPFDRLLVAQAQLENLPILTADTAFRRYDVKTVRA
ncbi:MAG TPA: type II toxin-antitoxin system VapC family toxin [Gemmatimonadaceae bacterium]|nr:type II toxin-antitoxin system VapC family toxin [Gemmatimonadaceae bacterium]